MNKSRSIFIKKTKEWTEQEVSFVSEVLEHTFENMFNSNELNHEVSVLLTNDEEIRELNKKYRKIDKPTNVLSFSITSDTIVNELRMIGDIVISKEKILSEAKDQNKTFNDHLAHIVIHGFLHLLNFTHDSKEDSTIMENKEVELLKMIDISNPYGDRI
ncbi:MAG: rRNA maturation RNase YbeY [Pseudomonadota bacterium]|nr:rRNA maturation RNase YbeY [Pseudomonadota bacterium]